MADDVDLATKLVETELTYALDKLRQNASVPIEGTKECTECGEKIPEPRRKLGFNLCVPCAEEAERRRSLFTDS
jgi:RNA polymerase-binding transcription factor DksA